MNSTPALELHQVSKSFKQVKAVQQVDLNIKQGQAVALLGPNGAGKTTLMDLIEGVQVPDSGTIHIFGKSWQKNAKELRQMIGVAFQETLLFDKLTVLETLNLFRSFYSPPHRSSEEILQTVGLAEHHAKHVITLSGGQRQKLVLGLSLINYPKMILLDEPSTGLDPNSRREIWYVLQALKQQNTTFVLTTHYMEEAEYLCDHIVIMNQGRIIEQGSVSDLLKDLQQTEIIELLISADLWYNKARFLLAEIPGVLETHWKESKLKATLLVQKITLVLPRILQALESNTIHVDGLECRRKNLDDLFITMTGRHLDE
ncbi:ABC transporter ATP-binding protein [Deltaproteobacteria bacterium TL4]